MAAPLHSVLTPKHWLSSTSALLHWVSGMFTTRSTSQQKTSKAFRCTLVSDFDPLQYVNAQLQMRSDNMKPLQEAEAKFKAGLKFRISNVGLDHSAKQEFLHTPLKQKIDLAKTKAAPLIQENDGATVQPCPSMCIKDCILLQQTQRFDVTALVDSLSDVRSVNETREVVKVTLIDDSGDDGKSAQLTFAFFMNSRRSKEDAAMMEDCRLILTGCKKILQLPAWLQYQLTPCCDVPATSTPARWVRQQNGNHIGRA